MKKLDQHSYRIVALLVIAANASSNDADAFDVPGCGATDDATRKWMERVANSAVESMQSTTRLEHEKETTKEQPKDTKYGHAQDKSQRRKRHEPQLERREHFEEMKIEDDEDFSRTIWQEEKWKIRRSAARTSHGGLTQHAHLYSDNPLKYNRAPHSTLASNANRRVNISNYYSQLIVVVQIHHNN